MNLSYCHIVGESYNLRMNKNQIIFWQISNSFYNGYYFPPLFLFNNFALYLRCKNAEFNNFLDLLLLVLLYLDLFNYI